MTIDERKSMTEIERFAFRGELTDADIRVVQIDGEPWFIAKDVCKLLGYDHTPSAVRRLDSDEYSQFTPNVRPTGGPPQRPMTIVNESGLYSLILWSQKPEAAPFKRWVTREVLPTIRKTGGAYIAPGSQAELGLTDPDTAIDKLIEMAQIAKEARDRQGELG